MSPISTLLRPSPVTDAIRALAMLLPRLVGLVADGVRGWRGRGWRVRSLDRSVTPGGAGVSSFLLSLSLSVGIGELSDVEEEFTDLEELFDRFKADLLTAGDSAVLFCTIGEGANRGERRSI